MAKGKVKEQVYEEYDGDWLEGKSHGIGTYKKIDHELKQKGDYTEELYQGEWFNCLKHGKGEETFANGDWFSGEYYMGFPQGLGTYIYKNKNKYHGNFLAGKKHGHGKFEYLNTRTGQVEWTYEGEW